LSSALQNEKGQPKHFCLATHDDKFIRPYLAHLRALGVRLTHDAWAWGKRLPDSYTPKTFDSCDVIFCEWALANAVWYSNNLPSGPTLIVRVHLQEVVNPRAWRFGHAINQQRVDHFVFVSEHVRRAAIERFGIDPRQTLVIPNFVEGDVFPLRPKTFSGRIRLGMVGMVPCRKRLDRVLDLAEELLGRGEEVEVRIKGRRPEAISWMRSMGRYKERFYYWRQYRRIRLNNPLQRAVIFEDWGNDMPDYYQNVDHILSPSDYESFHYALADGVLSGCHPLLWPWDEAEAIYSPQWIVRDVADAANRIQQFRRLSQAEREAMISANRELVLSRYATDKIFPRLDALIGLT
jgi:glycosyltransferase involved in cell wall biosynthesis